mgnify:CR=1 FL=1
MFHSKYRAKKVTTEDGTFDSKKELQRWEVLKGMQEQGLISDLERQVKFELLPKQILLVPRDKKGRKQKCELPVSYIADFVYIENGKQIVEDAKGMRTPEYILKRKMMKFLKDIEVKEV